MQPSMPERYPNWREAYGALAQSPHRGDHEATDELLEAHLRRLQSQVLQTLQARDRFYGDLKAYVEQPGRTPDHQMLVEEWGAVALKAFSQGSASHLQLAIERMLKTHREQRDRPVSIHSPQQPRQTRQQPKSLAQRLLGG
jgi:uridine phosphorylase